MHNFLYNREVGFDHLPCVLGPSRQDLRQRGRDSMGKDLLTGQV